MRVWIEIDKAIQRIKESDVTLRVRVWIEIVSHQASAVGGGVTLRVRVWIEIREVISLSAVS